MKSSKFWKALGFVVHDIVAHPFYGLLLIVGLVVPFLSVVADALHDVTVFRCNEDEELWAGRARR